MWPSMYLPPDTFFETFYEICFSYSLLIFCYVTSSVGSWHALAVSLRSLICVHVYLLH